MFPEEFAIHDWIRNFFKLRVLMIPVRIHSKYLPSGKNNSIPEFACVHYINKYFFIKTARWCKVALTADTTSLRIFHLMDKTISYYRRQTWLLLYATFTIYLFIIQTNTNVNTIIDTGIYHLNVLHELPYKTKYIKTENYKISVYLYNS